MNSPNPVNTTGDGQVTPASALPRHGADMSARTGNGTTTPMPGDVRPANPATDRPATDIGRPATVRPDRAATTADVSARTADDTQGDTGGDMAGDIRGDIAGDTSGDTDTTAGSTLDADTVALGFWDARPELSAIRQYARAAVCGPWAVLGCVLARVALSVPPSVVLPPLGNDSSAVASLNVFAALVGPSGSGKGVAVAAADGCLATPPGGGRLIEKRPLGSGEGISHVFVETDDDGQNIPANYSVWFDVPEIDTFSALVVRQGSTTASEVRKMFSGEGLGFQNSDVTRRKIVPAHSYRAALVAGVQPEKAGPLLDDAAGGTPQRFVWLPATDPGAPTKTPAAPEPLSWSSPILSTTTDRTMLTVAASIKAELRAERLARLREEITDNNGQQSLVRLKVAALLGLLARRTDVTEADWHLAGYVMAVSDRTRQRMRDTLHADAQRAVRERAEAKALFDEQHDDATIRRAARKVLARLSSTPTPASTVLASLGKNLREHFTDAVDELVRQGVAERLEDEYRGRSRVLLRLRQRDTDR